jgi:uncharacterized protein (DUF1778 family)
MHNVRPPVDVVSGALALAQQLPEEQQRQTLAAASLEEFMQILNNSLTP